jgi:hypothetical protein
MKNEKIDPQSILNSYTLQEITVINIMHNTAVMLMKVQAATGTQNENDDFCFSSSSGFYFNKKYGMMDYLIIRAFLTDNEQSTDHTQKKRKKGDM